MPGTTQEQAEQVARYAEILAARKAARRESVVWWALVGAGASSLLVLMAVVGSSSDSLVAVAVASSLFANVIAVWGLRHVRRDAERLTSIRHAAPPSAGQEQKDQG